MENELARITTKLSDEKFNILEVQRLKCIWYGEYLEIVGTKPRREKTDSEKAKATKERKKRIKQRKIEKEEKMKEEKMKKADYEMWKWTYGPKYEKEKEKESKWERRFISSFVNGKELFDNWKKEKNEWNKKVKAERAFGNLRNSANMLYKFIHANFYKWQGLHVTLTYSVPQYDDKEIYHDFKIFWQKLRYYYPNLGYISVLEPHQSGAWHIHLLLKDVTSNKIFVNYEDIRSYWNHGFCYISNMKSNEDYGWYFKKKIKADNPLLKYYKENVRYFRYSKNMKKPTVEIFDENSGVDIMTCLEMYYKKLNQYSLEIYRQEDFDEPEKKLTQIYYARYIVKEAWNKTIALRYKKKNYYELCEYRERLKLESKNESIDV